MGFGLRMGVKYRWSQAPAFTVHASRFANSRSARSARSRSIANSAASAAPPISAVALPRCPVTGHPARGQDDAEDRADPADRLAGLNARAGARFHQLSDQEGKSQMNPAQSTGIARPHSGRTAGRAASRSRPRTPPAPRRCSRPQPAPNRQVTGSRGSTGRHPRQQDDNAECRQGPQTRAEIAPHRSFSAPETGRAPAAPSITTYSSSCHCRP